VASAEETLAETALSLDGLGFKESDTSAPLATFLGKGAFLLVKSAPVSVVASLYPPQKQKACFESFAPQDRHATLVGAFQ